jgi:hypothetical protein
MATPLRYVFISGTPDPAAAGSACRHKQPPNTDHRRVRGKTARAHVWQSLSIEKNAVQSKRLANE